ncbi:beta-ketoacyl synthase [Tessaracoccus sp. ZS01]|uniref:beta-ketoacyl-[acyl-carrier-protein] synthase family protein n=1 Tax=Tessaracoccus sp. ZS01 TaxID=1906324 RepID=UPI00096D4FE3|nr:beta-ketoacyl-[acyl-carrier-protein] synthase family protein [Tessaracoccus sp. ZS01]MCG6566381.1 beta-ketoacyl-[acyl-carrier-protein] synthase family protein [Tessaracoccus sp. ZS01]OMG58843.1 beta-ketoacyl-[acyl-carrier-protein] synthase II [Tessaracoccus sp. ZS01]
MSDAIVITGIGATTPLGGDVASTWEGLLAGRSGVTALDEEWAQDLPSRIAAKVAVDPSEVIERVEARKLDRSTQLVLVAGLAAWADAGFGLGEDNPVDRDRLGVVCATGIGGLQSLLGNWDGMRDKGLRGVSPFTIPMLMANAPAANLGLKLGARAGIHTPVSACASSNEAIAWGMDMLRLGRADIVVVGGGEAVIHPLPLGAFAKMQALSRRNDEPTRASRPWDVDRDGFVLAEGAAIMVLERLDAAKARGAKIYGTVRGAGMSADGHDLVQPDPDGYGQSLAMARGLQEAGLTPAEIVHINAHGTSTPQGDVTEAGSIRKALGSHVDHVVVNSTKSMTGHLLGGAGALETLATVLSLKNRIVPGTINVDNIEPDLGIDVATENRTLPEGDLAAVNNSFGFGGHNVAVVVSNENITD